jgi:hypothetical protein
MSTARVAAVAVLALAGLAACSKSEAPKVDPATERAQATERAKQGPMGAQVKALEDAKGMQEDLNKKAQESVDRIEKDAK